MFDFLKDRKQRMTAQRNLKTYTSMLDVADVKCGYDYWRQVLINKIIRMFDYEGLPETIPAAELEKITLLTGHAGIVKSKYGYAAVPAQPYGVGLYPSYPPRAIWATPLIQGDGYINQDVVIIRNNNSITGINDTINRYARMLADVESTLAVSLVNVRLPSIAAAPDESTAYSYQSVRLAMCLGDTEAIINRSVLDDIKTIDAIKTIPATLLSDIITAREELLSQFFAEFGVASRQSKKAPMTISEVESDVQLMTVNVIDMLESRRESINNLNRVFNISAAVKLNPAYKPITAQKPESFNKTGDPRTGQSVEGADLYVS